jgi:hypothetical protein
VRKRTLLFLSLPLAAAGSLTGHAAGYALAGTSRQDAQVHGYLEFTPQFLAVCVALVALALGLRLTGRLQGRPAAWPFAVLPTLAFCSQELIERLAAGLPAHAVLELPVLAGLAAQLPVALAAYLLARALLRAADAAGHALASAPALPVYPTPLPAAGPVRWVAHTPLAFDRLGRAPPR